MRKAGAWITALSLAACLLALGFFLGRTSVPYAVNVRPVSVEAEQTQTVAERTMLADEKININTADEAQLQVLDGIGPALAARIVEYRTQNGGFRSVDELKNVKGIGEAKLEKLLDMITVED